MSINTPVAAKYEKVSGFWYVVDASDKQIVARCNSQVVADEIVSALNGVAEARGILKGIKNVDYYAPAEIEHYSDRAAAWLEKHG